MRVRFRRSLLRATHFSTEEAEGTEETQGKVIHRFQQQGSLGPSHGAELPRYVNAFSMTRLPVLPANGQSPIVVFPAWPHVSLCRPAVQDMIGAQK
jgi:hypothetical protein